MSKKIKLVQIISNLSLGGAQILLFDIVSELIKKSDIEIFIVTIDSGEFIDDFKKFGIRIYDLKEKGLVNPSVFFKLKKILKDINPDIVHTHLNKADFYGRIAAKIVNTPVILSTCHNYSTTHKSADVKKKSVFDYIDDLVIMYSGSYLIAISEIVKTYLINRNPIFEKKIRVIYNGVNLNKEIHLQTDIEKIKLRNNLGICENDFIICVSGRLEKQKGHTFLINSVKDILKKRKNIKIIITGEGSLKKSIEELILQNELSDYIILSGFTKEMEKIFEISDLVIVPSLWEGFGLVIIEAMIKKKLVLASDTGGIPEIIVDGKTGYLFESQNIKSFQEKLEYIIQNMDETNEIKENALKMVKYKFNIEKNSELYYSFYKEKYSEFRLK